MIIFVLVILSVYSHTDLRLYLFTQGVWISNLIITNYSYLPNIDLKVSLSRVFDYVFLAQEIPKIRENNQRHGHFLDFKMQRIHTLIGALNLYTCVY